jgi:hypothetical protein
MGTIMLSWTRHAINTTRLYTFGMMAKAGGIGQVVNHAGSSGYTSMRMERQ